MNKTMQLLKLKWELKNELLIEFALLFTVYLYAICVLSCSSRDILKYDSVKAVIHSKTYFGMEKDACVPTKPLNGVCMGVVFTYRGKEYTGYVKVDNDRYKIGSQIDLSVEKSDPTMFTMTPKRDFLKWFYWFLLVVLLGILVSIKLTLWSGKVDVYSKLLLSNAVIGLLFFTILLTMKK
jgi:hypothetical protein